MNKMSRTRCSTTRLGLSLAIAASAWSASAAPVTTNAPIIVTASRVDRTAQELPTQVTVITAEDINKSGAQNVVSALESLGGLYFRRNSDNPGQADISMRGFGQNSHGRVLVLVDGQRLNTADMATLDWLRIPVSSVERIEVLRGGQTALYGNYAVAGVINIITRQPTKDPVTTVSVTAGSDNTLSGHLGHVGTIGATRYTADLDWLQSDGWRDHSGYDNTDVRATLAHDWTERLSSTLSAFYTENNYDMPGSLSRSDLAQNPRRTYTPNDQAETRTFGSTLGANGQIDPDSRIEAAFSASQRDTICDWATPPYPFYIESILNNYTITPRYTWEDDIAGHNNRLLVGVDLGMDVLDLTSYSNAAKTNKNTDAILRRASAGTYVQDTFEITQALALTVGARYEIFHYSSDVADVFSDSSTSQETTYHQTAGDAALVYRPTDKIKLFSRVATLYRDPFLDELTGAYYGAPMLNLQPETGLQEEIGASAQLLQEWSCSLSAYRLDMQDEISYDNNNYRNENMADIRRYGADSSLTWARQNVGLVSATYNYVDARFSAGENEGNQVPLVPAHMLTLRGELALPCNLDALATVHAVNSQFLGDDNGNEDVKLPSYGTLDLGLRYHPHQAKNLTVVFGVNNVFDAIYANSGYSRKQWSSPNAYYPAAGRTWSISATYRF
jgi:iron complex outermembrane receptor protein